MARHIRHRRKVLVDVNNHDRWIVSYADFITLLFAFFVVMYSISSVNEGKYKSLTRSLGTAFSNKGTEEKALNPVAQNEPVLPPHKSIPLDITFETKIAPPQTTGADEKKWELTQNPFDENKPLADSQIKPFIKLDQSALSTTLSVPFESTKLDNLVDTEIKNSHEPAENGKKIEPAQSEASPNIDHSTLLDILKVPFESAILDNLTAPEVEKKRELSEEILKERRQLSQVSDQLENALGSFIDDNLVSVKRNDYWIELEMNSELLFLSGEAALSKKAQPVLKEIVQVINALPNAINVEGHTDDIPINNLKFPSNWDLSSARAASVVQAFVKEGVNPTRLSAVGYGEFHPIGDNTTEEGRFKNRRVTLVLMSQAFSRYGANDEERAKLLNLMPTANPNQSFETNP
jgi:chemotaxis protein MotB